MYISIGSRSDLTHINVVEDILIYLIGVILPDIDGATLMPRGFETEVFQIQKEGGGMSSCVCMTVCAPIQSALTSPPLPPSHACATFL
jgi:hypothetical protein